MAAFGDGLFKIDLNSNTKTQYAEQDGLDNLNLDGLKTNWYYSYNTVNFNVEPVENGEFIPMINSTSSNLRTGELVSLPHFPAVLLL